MSKPIKQTKQLDKLRYFSMFSGVGGFELGIGDLGECVGYSEIDKYAIMTYERHFKHDNYGDATRIDEQQLPDFDLLVGGFPCQAFSVAGQRKGFDDTRGTLFFDIARILKHKRSKHLVLENVKGLLSHDSGKTFQTILGVLADLGYGVEWQVLNGKRWIPQNRERVIIIGHLRAECGRKVLPFTAENSNDNGITGQTVSRAIEANYYKGVSPNGHQGSGRQLVRTDEQGSSDGRNKPNHTNGIRRASHSTITRAVLTPDRIEKRQNGRRMKEDGDPSFTLNTQDKHGVYDGVRIRRLTPLECERLMGWLDGWTEGVSDTQRYKQCGNGIISPMVTAIMGKMRPCLSGLEE